MTQKFNYTKKCRYGMMIYNKNDAYIGKSLDLYGEFSEEEVDLFRFFIKEGMTVFDIGANIGTHTIPFSQLVGELGKVFAYEPQRIIFQTLCGNLAINSITNVYCFQKALGYTNGIAEIFLPDYTKSNNFGGMKVEEVNNSELYEKVEVTSFDYLNIDKCDFIKVDIEGMERAFLLGGTKTINKFRPIMYLEDNMEKSEDSFLDILENLDYACFRHIVPLYNENNFFGNSQNVFKTVINPNVITIPIGSNHIGFEESSITIPFGNKKQIIKNVSSLNVIAIPKEKLKNYPNLTKIKYLEVIN